MGAAADSMGRAHDSSRSYGGNSWLQTQFNSLASAIDPNWGTGRYTMGAQDVHPHNTGFSRETGTAFGGNTGVPGLTWNGANAMSGQGFTWGGGAPVFGTIGANSPAQAAAAARPDDWTKQAKHYSAVPYHSFASLTGQDYNRLESNLRTPGEVAAKTAYETAMADLKDVMGGRGLYGSSMMSRTANDQINAKYLDTMATNAANAAASRYGLQANELGQYNQYLTNRTNYKATQDKLIKDQFNALLKASDDRALGIEQRDTENFFRAFSNMLGMMQMDQQKDSGSDGGYGGLFGGIGSAIGGLFGSFGGPGGTAIGTTVGGMGGGAMSASM